MDLCIGLESPYLPPLTLYLTSSSLFPLTLSPFYTVFKPPLTLPLSPHLFPLLSSLPSSSSFTITVPKPPLTLSPPLSPHHNCTQGSPLIPSLFLSPHPTPTQHLTYISYHPQLFPSLTTPLSPLSLPSLAQEGVDPSVQDGDGNSALMYAAAHGHREALLLVLAAFRSLHRVTFHGGRMSRQKKKNK